MNELIHVTMADPAGNRTAFVEEPMDRALYAPVGNILLQDEALHAEQVGYILADNAGVDGAMCMMGGEFCGNATRSFGYLIGQRMGKKPGETVRVLVSGASEILTVTMEEDGANVSMPAPQSVMPMDFALSSGKTVSYPVVALEGISHVLIERDAADEQIAADVLRHMKEKTDVEAAGAIFIHRIVPAEENAFDVDMTPVVWVRETDSTVWESSCGSGSLASGVWTTKDISDADLVIRVHQPGGILKIVLKKRGAEIKEAFLGGPVTLEPTVERAVSFTD